MNLFFTLLAQFIGAFFFILGLFLSAKVIEQRESTIGCLGAIIIFVGCIFCAFIIMDNIIPDYILERLFYD